MTKSEVIEKIEMARKIHKANLQKTLLLAKGIPLEGEPVAVSYRECGFGKLLYEDDGNLFKKIAGLSSFSEIEELHKQWHEDYYRIHRLYYEHEKGFFSKLFGGKPKLTELEQEQAKAYSVDLKETTWKLVRLLEKLEVRVKNMHEQEF